MESRCIATVSGRDGGQYIYQRTRRAKVERNGKRYCTQHDPKRREAKEKERERKWDRESKWREIGYDIQKVERELVEYVCSIEWPHNGRLRKLTNRISSLTAKRDRIGKEK